MKYFFMMLALGAVIWQAVLFSDKMDVRIEYELSILQRELEQTKELAKIDKQVQADLDRLAGIRPPIEQPVAVEIMRMSYKYDLEIELICATITQESRWESAAISHKGALGLMQVMPATARGYGYDAGALHDPIVNVQIGCRYLAEAVEKFGMFGGLVAYNAGPARAEKYLRHGSSVLLAETAVYVPKVLAYYDNYKERN